MGTSPLKMSITTPIRVWHSSAGNLDTSAASSAQLLVEKKTRSATAVSRPRPEYPEQGRARRTARHWKYYLRADCDGRQTTTLAWHGLSAAPHCLRAQKCTHPVFSEIGNPPLPHSLLRMTRTRALSCMHECACRIMRDQWRMRHPMAVEAHTCTLPQPPPKRWQQSRSCLAPIHVIPAAQNAKPGDVGLVPRWHPGGQGGARAGCSAR